MGLPRAMPVHPTNVFAGFSDRLLRLDQDLPQIAARAVAPLSGVVKAVNRLGDGGAVWLAWGAFEALRAPAKRREALAVGLTLGVVAVIVNLPMKRLVNRPRPDLAPGTAFSGHQVAGSSFPSGHAATSFAVAAVMPRSWLLGPLRWPLASLVALSRVLAGAHHPSDVVAGSAVGTVMGVYARRFLRGRSS